MASGTDGNVISYDASGNPVAIATGNDGQVLTSTGAGSPPAFETPAGGGAWTLIGTAVASSSSDLTITGLNSTYDTYGIAFSDLIPATDAVDACLRFGDSSGIDSGGSDYAWSNHYLQVYSPTSFNIKANNSNSLINMTDRYPVGSSTGEGFNGFVYLHTPGDSTTYSSISGQANYFGSAGDPSPGVIYGARKAVITLDRIQFFFSSGNVASGRLSVWGIAHA